MVYDDVERIMIISMDNYINSHVQLISYDQIYLNKLKPQLMALDLYIKESKSSFHVYEIADILEIETSEIISFMEKHDIENLDTLSLFQFIFESSSEICGYISRQWKYHTITEYSPEIISEIYNLNLHKVQRAFDDLNMAFVTDDELVEVFKRIHVTRFN